MNMIMRKIKKIYLTVTRQSSFRQLKLKYKRVSKYLLNISSPDAFKLRQHARGIDYNYEHFNFYYDILKKKVGRRNLKKMMNYHLIKPLI